MWILWFQVLWLLIYFYYHLILYFPFTVFEFFVWLLLFCLLLDESFSFNPYFLLLGSPILHSTILVITFIFSNLHTFCIFLTKYKVGQSPRTPSKQETLMNSLFSCKFPLANSMLLLSSSFSPSCIKFMKIIYYISIPMWLAYFFTHYCCFLPILST